MGGFGLGKYLNFDKGWVKYEILGLMTAFLLFFDKKRTFSYLIIIIGC